MTAPDADDRLRALERRVAELAAEVARLRERDAERADDRAAERPFGAAGDPLASTRARGAPPQPHHSDA